MEWRSDRVRDAAGPELLPLPADNHDKKATPDPEETSTRADFAKVRGTVVREFQSPAAWGWPGISLPPEPNCPPSSGRSGVWV